jgi:hypothetical protein
MAGKNRPNQIPPAVRKMLRKPPIMVGEDRADYEELVEIVRKEVNPRHPQEWVLMVDIIEAGWELVRLRGLKVGMLHAAMPRAFNSQILEVVALRPLEDDPKLAPAGILRKHLVGMLAGDEAAKKELDKLLAEHDLSWDILTATAFASTVVPLLHTDRMAGAARDRRNAAYADLEHLRATKPKSAALPETIAQDGDAEAQDDDAEAPDDEAAPTAPGNGAAGPGAQAIEDGPDPLSGR